MFQLDYKSGLPLCEQIINGFTRLWALKVVKGGDKLPSVRALATKLSVNPNTIQKAYAILEERGIIYSVPAKGSFFSDDKQAANAILLEAKEVFAAAVCRAAEMGVSREDLIEIIDKNIMKGGDV